DRREMRSPAGILQEPHRRPGCAPLAFLISSHRAHHHSPCPAFRNPPRTPLIEETPFRRGKRYAGFPEVPLLRWGPWMPRNGKGVLSLWRRPLLRLPHLIAASTAASVAAVTMQPRGGYGRSVGVGP